MGLLTLGVKRSSQFRGKIHNGFWLWKLAALIGILIGMIFAIQKVEEDLFLFWWKNIGLAIGRDLRTKTRRCSGQEILSDF